MKRSVLINLISSMLATILVVIAILLVMVFTGKLDVNQHVLVISSASHTITYDGKALVDNKWSLMEGSLREGHKLSVSVTGSQTNVGMSENYISAIVLNENGEDVTKEYTIEYRPGALQVKARELTIVAESDMKLYDGTPLTCNTYMLQSSVALLASDVLNVTIEGSIIEVGEVENVITSAKVLSRATGEDVSRNYNIHSKNGKLIVYDENALVIKSGDDMKIYDGTPLTGVNTECEIVNGALREGHTMAITYTGSQLFPGTSENTFDVRILDDGGNDVTHLYQVLKDYGTLIVKNATLKITGLDAAGEYGPNDFTSTAHTQEGLPEGHTLELEDAFLGTIPGFSVGTVPNTIDTSKIKVLDASGNNVTECFDITADQIGTLTVSEDYPCFRVTMDRTGDLYLKQMSYGNYNLETKSWEEAVAYNIQDNAISSPYYLPLGTLMYNNVPRVTAEITPLSGIFAMPYYSADESGNLQQTSDVLMVGDATTPYTVQYYGANLLELDKISQSLSTYEEMYSSFVYENYLFVDSETRDFMEQYASTYMLVGDDRKQLVVQIAEHLRNNESSGLVYNMQYDTAMDEADNPTIAFLSQYRQGVCRHYAQAATLLYRSLGIPARYTVGFYAYASQANQEFVITNKQAHAWVEVYLDDIGWVYVEVTGSLPRFKITPKDVEKLYDKDDTTGLYPQEFLIEGKVAWSTFLEMGYSMDLEVGGGRTTPGRNKSSVISCTIKDPSGNILYQYEDGYVIRDSKAFEIQYGRGDVHLYRAVISLKEGNEKIYGDDWKRDLKFNENLDSFDYFVEKGELLPEHTFTLVPIAALKAKLPGSYANTYQVLGENVNEYKFTFDGVLTVKLRSITVCAGSGTAIANGSPQTYADATDTLESYTLGTLAPGDEVDWDVLVITSETATNSGDYAFTIADRNTLKIYDADGNDVTACYSVSFKPGRFEIVEP